MHMVYSLVFVFRAIEHVPHWRLSNIVMIIIFIIMIILCPQADEPNQDAVADLEGSSGWWLCSSFFTAFNHPATCTLYHSNNDTMTSSNNDTMTSSSNDTMTSSNDTVTSSNNDTVTG